MEITGYVKYMRPNIIDGLFGKGKIRFTQPIALNDPLEFNPILSGYTDEQHINFEVDGIGMPSVISWDRINLIKRKMNSFGVLSLTKNYDSFDMWSHYADGHSGFMIELKEDFNEHSVFKSTDGSSIPLKKVSYTDRYEINVLDLNDGSGCVDDERFKEKLFFTKVSRWRFEKEYRMVRLLSDLGKKVELNAVHLFDFPRELIKSVVFGAYMTVENKRQIVQALNNVDVDFLQSVILRDQCDASGVCGKMHLMPLAQEKIPEVLTWNNREDFVVEARWAESLNKVIELKDASQLPYYKHSKEMVDQWVAHKRGDMAR